MQENLVVGRVIKIVAVTCVSLGIKVSFKLKPSGELVEYCRLDTRTHRKVCRQKMKIPHDVYQRMRDLAQKALEQQ